MDPYRARGPRRQVAQPEVETPKALFARRLRALGATPDEVAAAVAGWDDLDDVWTVQRRVELVSASDDTLRAEIAAVRDEYAVGTTTEEEAAAQERERAYVLAQADAAGRIGGSVGDLVAWVGGDPARAHAVYALESAPEGGRRSSLLARLIVPAERWGPLP